MTIIINTFKLKQTIGAMPKEKKKPTQKPQFILIFFSYSILNQLH